MPPFTAGSTAASASGLGSAVMAVVVMVAAVSFVVCAPLPMLLVSLLPMLLLLLLVVAGWSCSSWPGWDSFSAIGASTPPSPPGGAGAGDGEMAGGVSSVPESICRVLLVALLLVRRMSQAAGVFFFLKFLVRHRTRPQGEESERDPPSGPSRSSYDHIPFAQLGPLLGCSVSFRDSS